MPTGGVLVLRRMVTLKTVGGPTWYAAFSQQPTEDDVFVINGVMHRVILVHAGTVFLQSERSKLRRDNWPARARKDIESGGR